MLILLTELLQLFELKDFLLSLLVPWAEVQGWAFQHKPARPPVVQVMALFVVQPANQLAVPLQQSLDFRRDEALRVAQMEKEGERAHECGTFMLYRFLLRHLKTKSARKTELVQASSCRDKPLLSFCSPAELLGTCLPSVRSALSGHCSVSQIEIWRRCGRPLVQMERHMDWCCYTSHYLWLGCLGLKR